MYRAKSYRLVRRILFAFYRLSRCYIRRAFAFTQASVGVVGLPAGLSASVPVGFSRDSPSTRGSPPQRVLDDDGRSIFLVRFCSANYLSTRSLISVSARKSTVYGQISRHH